MHSIILKAALGVFSIIASTSLIAQCGPGGCGVQRGNYNSYDYPTQSYYQAPRGGGEGYQNQYYQAPRGGESYQNQYYQPSSNQRGWQDNRSASWGGGQQGSNKYDYYDQHPNGGGSYTHEETSHENIDKQPMNGGGQQNWQAHSSNHSSWNEGHDGSGYSQQMPDHPVTGQDGKPVVYYGQPGPDYNTNKRLPPSSSPMNQTPAAQKANYQYAPNNNWSNVANADHLQQDRMYGGGSDMNTSNAKPEDKATDASKPAPKSNW